jgi:septal ring factor EnvC (AmiA/AmiB activator)
MWCVVQMETSLKESAGTQQTLLADLQKLTADFETVNEQLRECDQKLRSSEAAVVQKVRLL